MKAVPDKPDCCIWDCKSHEGETWDSVFMSPVCETSPVAWLAQVEALPNSGASRWMAANLRQNPDLSLKQ